MLLCFHLCLQKLEYTWLEYEDREIALVNSIQSLESKVNAFNKAANYYQDSTLKIDKSKSIAEQLDYALQQSKDYVLIIMQQKSKLKNQEKANISYKFM